MLKVWIIQTGEPLLIHGDERKMRSNLLAEELARRGHEVVLWVSAFDHNAKKWAIKSGDDLIKRDGISVRVLKGTGYRKNVSLARYIDHRVIAWQFGRLAKTQNKPDVIVASLPPHDLAYQCVKYARANDVPVIVDIRDLWPDIFVDSLPSQIRFLGRALLFNDFKMVKKTLGEANCLTAVSNSFFEWGLKYADRLKSESDRVFYLGYHEPGMFSSDSIDEEFRCLLDNLREKKVVTFIGSFSWNQDTQTLVDCIMSYKNNGVVFVVTGSGSEYEFVRSELSSCDNCYLVGWLNRVEIDALLSVTDIGVCPYPENSEIFPNKAFMYMSQGIPIASSLKGDLEKIIESEHIGINYTPGDSTALGEAIKTLANDPDTHRKMTENARVLFETKFLEAEIYKEFADHIERLAI